MANERTSEEILHAWDEALGNKDVPPQRPCTRRMRRWKARWFAI